MAEAVIPSTYGESLLCRQGVGLRLDFPFNGVLFQAFAGNKAEPFYRRSLAIREKVFRHQLGQFGEICKHWCGDIISSK